MDMLENEQRSTKHKHNNIHFCLLVNANFDGIESISKQISSLLEIDDLDDLQFNKGVDSIEAKVNLIESVFVILRPTCRFYNHTIL